MAQPGAFPCQPRTQRPAPSPQPPAPSAQQSSFTHHFSTNPQILWERKVGPLPAGFLHHTAGIAAGAPTVGAPLGWTPHHPPPAAPGWAGTADRDCWDRAPRGALDLPGNGFRTRVKQPISGQVTGRAHTLSSALRPARINGPSPNSSLAPLLSSRNCCGTPWPMAQPLGLAHLALRP